MTVQFSSSPLGNAVRFQGSSASQQPKAVQFSGTDSVLFGAKAQKNDGCDNCCSKGAGGCVGALAGIAAAIPIGAAGATSDAVTGLGCFGFPLTAISVVLTIAAGTWLGKTIGGFIANKVGEQQAPSPEPTSDNNDEPSSDSA